MKFVSFTEGENECKRTGVFSKDELFSIYFTHNGI